MAQTTARHLPVVGLVGLVLIAAVAGSVFYSQFIAPPAKTCGVPVHRVYFMTAIIKELGGFQIQRAGILNQTSLPQFSNVTGPATASLKNMTLTDRSTVFGNPGDNVTIYVKSISSNETTLQYPSATGHGFAISGSIIKVVNGTLPTSDIRFGRWYTVTIQITGTGSSNYFCTQSCSQQHPSMNGPFRGTCGA